MKEPERVGVWMIEVRIPTGEKVAPGWYVEYRVSGEDYRRVAADVRMVGLRHERRAAPADAKGRE